MSFDKYMGKEHRKQYRGAKAVDSTCRNNGSCAFCRENRTFKNIKRLAKCEFNKYDYNRNF